MGKPLKRADVIAIKYPPSGKEVWFSDGTWTNAGIETKNYSEDDIIKDYNGLHQCENCSQWGVPTGYCK